jgi:nucleotide-binding universal stress UspA family protein
MPGRALDAPAECTTMDNHAPNARRFVLLAAVDLADTDSGGYALDQAMRIATRIPDAQMHVLHVTDQNPEQQTLDLLRHYVTEKAETLPGFALQGIGVHVRKGEPSHVIAQLAAEIGADMVVVGTHRVPSFRTMIKGHTGERVTTESACPVVVAGPRPTPEAPHVIVIDGPCPDCVLARRSSAGRTWWCARHAEHHPVLHRPHLYAYETELPYGQHDSEVTATGVD